LLFATDIKVFIKIIFMYKSVTTGKALILVPFDMRILLRKVIIDNFIAYINISMTKLK